MIHRGGGRIGYRPGNEWLQRSVDPVRYRALIRIALVGALVLLAFLAAYWPRHEAVRLGYRTEALRLEKERLERDIQHHQLRLSELVNPERVERLARERLGLGPPSQVAVLDIAGGAPGLAARREAPAPGGRAATGALPRP